MWRSSEPKARGCVDAAGFKAAFSWARRPAARAASAGAGRPLRLTVSDRTRAMPSSSASGRPFPCQHRLANRAARVFNLTRTSAWTLQQHPCGVRTRTWQVALQVAPMSIWGRSATLATDRERDVARAVTSSAIRGPARSSGNQVVGSANSPFAILPAAPRSRFCLTGFASMIRAPVAQSTSRWSARICGRRRPRNSSCALFDETLESRVAQRTAELADANQE